MIEGTEFKDCFWGLNGFEELKKYMRLGSDFCKDLCSILTERAEHELTYSKGLNKTSLRLQKLSKDFHGSLSEAWLKVSIQIDTESEMHRTLASAIQEEIIKPLKILSDNQNKCRKPVEAKVEKVTKNLCDKKAEDYKYRNRCFQLSKEIEKYMYSLDEAQKGVCGKPPNNKEIQKIESQILKTRENLEKSETKYHKACSSVELARQDWQIETLRGCIQMQDIEIDRISSLEQLIKKLSIQIGLLSKKMSRVSDVYENINVDVNNDIHLMCKKYGTSTNNGQEVYLYDVYPENTKNMMNRGRRIESLTRWSELFNTDMEFQQKAKDGLDKVKSFAKENPNFNVNNEADIIQKMQSVNLMRMLYEGSLYKVQLALSDLWDTPKPTFKYSNLISTTYDKQGVPSSVLKLSGSFLIDPFKKASAPSPPLSPASSTNSSNQHISNSNYNNINASSTHTLSSIQAPVISMPMPCHIYDSNSSTSGNSSNSSGVGSSSGVYAECSSASSISTSSVSPSSNSSTHQSQTSPQQQIQQTTNSVRSSYLLTTAVNNNNSTSPYCAIDGATVQMPYPKFNNLHLENHYNNSNHSLSDDDDDWNDNEQVIIGVCVAQYDYKCVRNDELNLKQGDTIEIIEKRTDGWWRGQLNNSIGLFPSTYVKET